MFYSMKDKTKVENQQLLELKDGRMSRWNEDKFEAEKLISIKYSSGRYGFSYIYPNL